MRVPRLLKQVLWIVLMTVLLLGVPRLGGAVADQFDYSAIDPDGVFAWASVRHVVQALIFLGLMLVIRRSTDLRFGFGLGDTEIGLLYVRILSLIFAAYAIGSVLIMLVAGAFTVFPYPLTTRNVLGQLGFQLFLSGPSEELIFRAFAITMLALFVSGPLVGGDTVVGRGIIKVFGGLITVPNLLAAIIFGLAHVRFTLIPFSATFSTFQVIYAFILGLFYGVCYERSDSVLYPMAMHSITNVVGVGVTVIAALLLG